MKSRWNRVLILSLFAALITLLLWFQGIILRHEPAVTEVPPPPAVTASDSTALVELRTLASVQVFPGYVEAVDPAPLSARVMAVIAEVAARENDAVSAGQVLVTLDAREARAQLAQARAALSAAEAQALAGRLAFERADRLLAAEALTPQDWEAARAASDGAEAGQQRAAQAVEGAEAALSWFELAAPFDGRVLAREADPGQLASPGQPVLVLYRPDRLRFAVAIPEERTSGLALGADFTLEFANGETRPATLARVLPGADPRSGTVTLHLALEDVTGLQPGQLGRISLVVGEREALVLPARAVERIGQIERVRLVRAGGAVSITVRTGKLHGTEIEALSGLAAGDRVLLP